MFSAHSICAVCAAVSSPIPPNVTSAVLAVTVVGVAACSLTIVRNECSELNLSSFALHPQAFIFVFHRRTAVRAASPYFLLGNCRALHAFALTCLRLCF